MDGQGLQHGPVGGQGPGVPPLQRLGSPVTCLGLHLGRPVDDVLPVVAVLGYVVSGGPGGQRCGEGLHLEPAVVDVELAHHLIAAPVVQAGHRVAVAGTPSVPGVQRTGRVGAHELDDHPGAVALVVAGPPVDTGGHHVSQYLVQPRVGQAEVDEPGTSHLDAHHVGRWCGLQAFGQLGSQFPGVATRGLRRSQCHVGRPVAVVRVPGAFQLDGGRQRVNAQVGQHRSNRSGDAVAHVHGRRS